MEFFEDVDPVELTQFTREIVDAQDAEPDTLSAILPNELIDDIQVEWTVSQRMNLLAKVRSYDNETPIGSGGGAEQRVAKLPPLGLKQRFSEYEQLRRRARNSPENVQAAAERKGIEVGRATLHRVQLMRGEVLQTGKLAFNENGVKLNVDFFRKSDFTKTAGTLWDAGGDPLRDLETWMQEFADENEDSAPDVLVASRRIANALRDGLVAKGYFGKDTVFVKNEDVNGILTDRGLPALVVNDRKAGGKRLVSDDTLVLALAGQAGSTTWGTPVEVDEPEYQQMDPAEAPGLLVGAYKQNDPAVKWIRANAIAMPVLANPNATLAAKVL